MPQESRSIDRNDPFPAKPAGPLEALTTGPSSPGNAPGAAKQSPGGPREPRPDRPEAASAGTGVAPGETAKPSESATIHFAAGRITVRSLAGGALALRLETEPTEGSHSYALAGTPAYEPVTATRDNDGAATVRGSRLAVHVTADGSRLALHMSADSSRLEVTAPVSTQSMAQTAGSRSEPAGHDSARSAADETGRAATHDAAGDPAAGPAGRETLLTTVGSPFFHRRSRIGIKLALNPGERVYGLGERMGFLDKRGKSYLNWNTDDPFIRENTDPLYQSIPVAVRFRPGGAPQGEPVAADHALPDERAAAAGTPQTGDGSGKGAARDHAPVATGLFLDYPGASWFDVDSKGDGCMRIHQPETAMNLYIFPGPGLDDVVEQYTALTGRIPLPPKWALGFHQSRYSYFTAERVEEVAGTFREHDIPIDAIYLDIDYMDGYRVFTWNPDTFGDPAALTAKLRERGIRVITIVDPGVKADPDYRVYRDGLKRDVCARRTSGEVYHGEVWPGPSVFPDFTKKETRKFWAEHHAALLGEGVSGIWNDMNEPADFTGEGFDRTGFTPPKELLLDGDGNPKGHEHYHNAYANGMAQATRKAFAKYKPDERGFVLTRAGYAGIQRHAAVWNGDIDSSWHHLAQSIPMFLNMGLSGVAFVGSDIGGFQYNASPELYTRWMQFAVFSPYLRAHTAVDTGDHEPWSFGERVEHIAAEAIRTRYRYLPYIYSVFRECSRSGRPVMRSLVSAFPDDSRVHAIWDQYLFGPSLMVCPVVYPDVRSRHVYLPEGLWVDVYTGAEHEGPCDIVADAPLERIPVFVRTPAVLPAQPVTAHTGITPETLSLHVFPGVPGSKCRFDLYDDDGVSHRAADGEYRVVRLALESAHEAGRSTDSPRSGRSAEPPRAATLSLSLSHNGWNEGPQSIQVVHGGTVVQELTASEIPVGANASSLTIEV